MADRISSSPMHRTSYGDNTSLMTYLFLFQEADQFFSPNVLPKAESVIVP